MNKLIKALSNIQFKDETTKFSEPLDPSKLMPSINLLPRMIECNQLTIMSFVSQSSLLDLSGIANHTALFRMRHLDRLQGADTNLTSTGIP